MAVKTWIGTGAWATGTNWSPAGAPAAGDEVFFSSANNSPCTVAANTNALLSLNFQDYAGTVTINTNTVPFPNLTPFILTVAGNVTLSTNSSFQLTTDANLLGTLAISASSIVTSNGRTIGAALRFTTVNTTIQLADAMILSRALVAFGTPSGFINLISSTPTVQRSLTLVNNGTTDQYVDYLNVTDINGSGGATIWTYKGNPPVNSQNWFVMTTQPPPVSRISF
jgi:hypothetical protein